MPVYTFIRNDAQVEYDSLDPNACRDAELDDDRPELNEKYSDMIERSKPVIERVLNVSKAEL